MGYIEVSVRFGRLKVANAIQADAPNTSSAPPLIPHSSRRRLSKGTFTFSPNCGLESVDLVASSDRSGGKYVDGDEIEVYIGD